MTDTVEVYDPATNAWSRAAALPAPRAGVNGIPTPVHGVTGAAFLNGWIHLPGGGTTRGGNSGSIIHQMFRAVVDCGG
jgi:Kelch motif